MVITRPIIRQLNGKLHSETHPAIEWSKEKYYFLYGIEFDKELWEGVVKKKIKVVDVLILKNIEQRMAALKVLGAETLLNELNAEKIDESTRGNVLYKI